MLFVTFDIMLVGKEAVILSLQEISSLTLSSIAHEEA